MCIPFRLDNTSIPGLPAERERACAEALPGYVLQENTSVLKHPLGKGLYHEVYFDNVHIGYGDALLSDKILLDVFSEQETVELHFALKGENTARLQNFPQQVCFKANQHNIIYANRNCGSMEWACGAFQLFEINLSPGFFARFLPDDTALFAAFRKAIDRRASTLMHPQHKLISLPMYQLVQDIMHCQRKGIFKRMFLEAKVTELLLLQLEQYDMDRSLPAGLAAKDIEKMYAVREFIVSNLDTTCSLIDLAHRAGTNEFTLKKGFKAVFGTTVFGFWADLKMDQARKMLLEQHMNVNEVADHIGYKHARHFTTAFKKKYGILPGKLKR